MPPFTSRSPIMRLCLALAGLLTAASAQAANTSNDELAIDISYSLNSGSAHGQKEARLRKNTWSTIVGPEDKAASFLVLGRVNEQPHDIVAIELMVLDTNHPQLILSTPQITTRLHTMARLTQGADEGHPESATLVLLTVQEAARRCSRLQRRGGTSGGHTTVGRRSGSPGPWKGADDAGG
jgi:hypothetical protein